MKEAGKRNPDVIKIGISAWGVMRRYPRANNEMVSKIKPGTKPEGDTDTNVITQKKSLKFNGWVY